MAVAALLEGLQAFTPDRSAYLPAVFYGAAGALAAALIAELFIRAWRLRVGRPRNNSLIWRSGGDDPWCAATNADVPVELDARSL
jgi:hypothetical protein